LVAGQMSRASSVGAFGKKTINMPAILRKWSLLLKW
jgi:hypothetical protein